MAVRSSMQYIIDHVRVLINDPDDGTPQFTSQSIQDQLDVHRLDLYQDCLTAADTRTSTGDIEWHDFFSRYAFWETDYLVQKASGPTNTPDTVELLVGKFHYNAHQDEPLIITGKVYNVYGVSARLLNTWIATLRSQIYSWTADGTTIQRAGQIRDMRELAASYSSMAWGWGNSTQIKLRRKDLRF